MAALLLYTGILQAQTIVPIQTDEIIIDNGVSGKADPGDRIRYKVAIQNTGGPNGSNTQLNIVPDPRTTFVPGSFRSSPLALPDAYTCTGNVGISISAASGVKANDFDDNTAGLTVTAGSFATTQGGSIMLNTDGSFMYSPPAGFTGTDTYTYTLNDGNGVGAPVPTSDLGLITFTISDLIWFVDNSVAGPGTGTVSDPFKTLASAQSASAINQVVFVKNTGTSYTGGIILKNGQLLYGTGHTGGSNLADPGVLPFTMAPNSKPLPAINGTRPVITNTSGDGITLAVGNTVRGLNIGVCSDFGIDDNGTVGTLTISEVDINTTGGGFRTDNGGTLAVTLGAVTAGGIRGIHLAGTAGSFSVSGATTTSGTVNQGIWIDNTSTNVSFAAITISSTGSGSNAFELSGNSGTFNASGTTTINAPVAGGSVSLLVSGGTGGITFANIDINGRRDIGFHISGGSRDITTGTLDIDNSNSVASANAFQTSNVTGGTMSFGATTINANATNSHCMSINNTAAAITFAAGSAVNNSNVSEIDIVGGNGNVTYNGTVNSTAGQAVAVGVHTGGTVEFTGNITANGGNTGILLSQNSGGTIIFSGASKSLTSLTTVGVSMFNCIGTTVNFTNGGLVINTTATGFQATSGGTLTVQGTGNTINSTAATAFNMINTTIGASGITFQSISSAGTGKGIVVNTSGSGAFTVTGVGVTDGSGGTIQNITTRGAEFISAQNITLKNMNFTNACTADFPAAPTGLSLGNNTADNASIHLQSVSNVVLDNLNITTSAEQGINGHNVNGFTLSNSVLSGLGNGPDEDGLHFYNMVGTCAITNTSITSSGDDNVNIQNNTTPIAPPTSVGTITVTGGSFNTGVLGSGVLFGIRGTSNTTIDIAGVTINDNFSGGVVADCFDNATMDLEVSTTTITNNNDAISLSSHNGNTKFDIHDNSNISGQDAVNIAIQKSAFSTTGTLEGRIRNNAITTENDHIADGIFVFNAGGSALTVAITNNNINYAGTQRAINVQGGQDGASILEATITGNTMDIKLDGTGNAVNAILVNSQVADPSGAGSSLCVNIGGAGALANTITHSLGGTIAGGDIRVRQRFSANIKLPGYAGGATDTAAVGTYLDGRNTVVSASTASFLTGTFSGGAACVQPTN